MPQVIRKSAPAVSTVQGSKRQTYNSTKGEVLLVCDEEALSESQQLVYTEHEEKMKAYIKALEAYNKAYGKLDSATGPVEGTGQKAPTASLSCEGSSVVQNGVVVPQQSQPQKPQQQQVPKSVLQVQQPQSKPQQNALVPIAQPAKKATIVTGGTWRPQMVAGLVNKTIVPPTIPMAPNIVTTTPLAPRLVTPIQQPAQKTIIQVPVGTDLSNMQVVNVASTSGNYQLLLQPQVTYPALKTNSVLPQTPVPVGSNVLPQSTPVQNVLVPITSSTRLANPVTNQVKAASAGKTLTGKVAKIQAVSVGTTPTSSNKEPVTSQAGSNKRAATEDGDRRKSKRSKVDSSPSQDVVENYYGWKQGRLWWGEDKPRGSFRCYVCNKKLPTNIRYMQHVRHHLEKEQQQNASKNISSCRSCFKQFKSPHALRYHTERYHKYCEHRCGICDLPCDDSQSLLKHLSKNHQSLQMPYVCGVCNYATSICDDLILHFNKHHEGSKALMCPFCVRIIRCNNSFLRHCKTHLSVSIKSGNFHCRFCKLMFLSSSMLKEHVQEDHKQHSLKDRNGVPTLPAGSKGKPAEAAPIQKVSFPKQTNMKVSPSLWSRREIIHPRGSLRCVECGLMIEHCIKEHFRKKMTCNRCSYTTYCGTAFANHMIGFHKAGSTPKLHRVRKTFVNNGRILLGCRNCEFSTLSPTLMTCHIESCPRGALTIESFKVRTYSLQSSRRYKREVLSIGTKTRKPNENSGEDDEVVVIEEDVLVDLTDDEPSTSKEREQNSPKPTSESKVNDSPLKNVSVTVKLEKLPDDLNLDKLALGKDGSKDDKKETCTENVSELDNQEQSTSNGEEQIKTDELTNKEDSNDSTAQKAPSEHAEDNTTSTAEPDNNETSEDSKKVEQTQELRIKREQIDS